MKTREELLAVGDLPRGTVDVPEWGAVLNIRALGLEAMMAIEAEKRPHMKVVLTVIHCVEDEAGALIYQVSDLDVLAKKNPMVLTRIATEVAKLTPGMLPVEDTAKN